jgi:hypothetical protein
MSFVWVQENIFDVLNQVLGWICFRIVSGFSNIRDPDWTQIQQQPGSGFSKSLDPDRISFVSNILVKLSVSSLGKFTV